MRSKEEISLDTKPYDKLTLEVLLDIRDILSKKKPLGRPRKNKRSVK